jgi:hypothetical protein
MRFGINLEMETSGYFAGDVDSVSAVFGAELFLRSPDPIWNLPGDHLGLDIAMRMMSS